MLNNLFKVLLLNDLLLILLIVIPETKSGANNLHILDGISTYDIIAGDIFFEIIDPVDLEYTYRIRPAKDFGAPFNASFRAHNVALVPTIPFHACTDDFVNADDIEGNIAFVERGECTFMSKVVNAEKVGARAVIITETDKISTDYDYYIEMIHDNSDREVNIPAGYLLGKNGRIIRSTLKKLRRKYAIINLPVNLTFTPPNQINHPPWLGW